MLLPTLDLVQVHFVAFLELAQKFLFILINCLEVLEALKVSEVQQTILAFQKQNFFL